MVLSQLGQHAHNVITNIENHQWYAHAPSWVVMPDHIHLIVMIDERGHLNDDINISCSDVRSHVATTNARLHVAPSNLSNSSNSMSHISPKTGSLPIVINQIKRSITKYAHDNHLSFAWQRKYWDKILYNQIDFDRYKQYIENNIANW